MTPDAEPSGWVELQTRADWERVRKLRGYIIITDEDTDAAERGPKYHHRNCRAATLADFTTKVLKPRAAGQRPNGRYFWVDSERAARAGGARRCELPDDPLYE